MTQFEKMSTKERLKVALGALERTEKNFRALCIFNPELRRLISVAADRVPSPESISYWSSSDALEKALQSSRAGSAVPPFPRQDMLCEDLAQKMSEIFKAESIASYISFYKDTHAKHEHRKIHSEERTVVKNPSSFYLNDLSMYIGGSDFKAYRDMAGFVSTADRDRFRVQYAIFLEQAAASSLMDICIQIDPNGFFSSQVFSKMLASAKNFQSAIRANRAFLDTDLARSKFRLFSSREVSEFYRALERVGKDKDRNKIKHVQLRRLLLLFKMCEPEIFSSRVLVAKDFLNFLDARKSTLGIEEIPSADHFNQIIGKFLDRKVAHAPSGLSPLEFMSSDSPGEMLAGERFRDSGTSER